MKVNWFYVLVGFLFVGMLFISSRYFKGSSDSTVGITYAKDYIINAEKSASVIHVNVVPGQEVKIGDLLVGLSSRQLNMDIDRLQNRINAQKTEQAEKAKLVISEIAYSKAQHNIVLEGIDADSAELKSELTLNQQLTNEFVNEKETRDHSQDPHQLRLASLARQKDMHTQALDIKVQDLFQENKTEQTLLTNQINLLEQELNLLTDERNKLNKYATFSGVVKNVFVKNNEEVAAYTPMLSINPTHPTTVVGYFTVSKERDLPIGGIVSVRSYNHPGIKVSGKLIGLGSIVELPQILQKSTAVKAFGHEVFIEIGLANEFAVGEKVLIK